MTRRRNRWASRRTALILARFDRRPEDSAYALALANVPNHPVSLPVRRTP